MFSSQEVDNDIPWMKNPGLNLLHDNLPISPSKVNRSNSFQKLKGFETPPKSLFSSGFNSISSSKYASLIGSPEKSVLGKRDHSKFSNAVNFGDVYDQLMGLQDPEMDIQDAMSDIQDAMTDIQDSVIDKKQKTILHYFSKASLVAKVTEKKAKGVTEKKAKENSSTTVPGLTQKLMLGKTTLKEIQENYNSDGTEIEDYASETEQPEEDEQPTDVRNTTEQETEELNSSVESANESSDEGSVSDSDQSSQSATEETVTEETVTEETEENEIAEKRTTKRYRLQNNVKKTRVGRAKNVNGDVRYFCTHCTNSYPLSKNLIWHLWGKKGHRCLEAGNEGYRWIKPTKCVEAQQLFMAENGWTFECMDSVQLVPDDFDPKPYHCPVEGCRMKFHEKRGLKKHIEKTCDEGHEAARVLGHLVC